MDEKHNAFTTCCWPRNKKIWSSERWLLQSNEKPTCNFRDKSDGCPYLQCFIKLVVQLCCTVVNACPVVLKNDNVMSEPRHWVRLTQLVLINFSHTSKQDRYTTSTKDQFTLTDITLQYTMVMRKSTFDLIDFFKFLYRFNCETKWSWWRSERVSEQFLNGTSAHIRLFSALP